MIKKEQIISIIYDAIDEINTMNDLSIEKNLESRLFGSEGSLDSFGLVNLIVLIEESVNEKFECSITLADEKAMSLKRSPFRTVDSLANYIIEQLTL